MYHFHLIFFEKVTYTSHSTWRVSAIHPAKCLFRPNQLKARYFDHPRSARPSNTAGQHICSHYL